jgi:hypothetical protein
VKNFISTLGFIIVALYLLSSVALAVPSCTNWMVQADGSYWRECVNDDGSRHCYRAANGNGSNATEISCR